MEHDELLDGILTGRIRNQPVYQLDPLSAEPQPGAPVPAAPVAAPAVVGSQGLTFRDELVGMQSKAAEWISRLHTELVALEGLPVDVQVMAVQADPRLLAFLKPGRQKLVEAMIAEAGDEP